MEASMPHDEGASSRAIPRRMRDMAESRVTQAVDRNRTAQGNEEH
jgi:hypothetical protein